jgi:hypothetical protein
MQSATGLVPDSFILVIRHAVIIQGLVKARCAQNTTFYGPRRLRKQKHSFRLGFAGHAQSSSDHAQNAASRSAIRQRRSDSLHIAQEIVRPGWLVVPDGRYEITPEKVPQARCCSAAVWISE